MYSSRFPYITFLTVLFNRQKYLDRYRSLWRSMNKIYCFFFQFISAPDPLFILETFLCAQKRLILPTAPAKPFPASPYYCSQWGALLSRAWRRWGWWEVGKTFSCSWLEMASFCNYRSCLAALPHCLSSMIPETLFFSFPFRPGRGASFCCYFSLGV